MAGHWNAISLKPAYLEQFQKNSDVEVPYTEGKSKRCRNSHEDKNKGDISQKEQHQPRHLGSINTVGDWDWAACRPGSSGELRGMAEERTGEVGPSFLLILADFLSAMRRINARQASNCTLTCISPFAGTSVQVFAEKAALRPQDGRLLVNVG